MELIIATAKVEFAKKLKEAIKEYDSTIEITEVVTCEDLIEALRKNPKVDGVILKTDLALKLKDPRLEHLSDVIYSIRTEKMFEQLTFTIISDYNAGHPFLAELFEMGIYNFYARNETQFTIENLIETLKTPMSFSMAVKYRNASPDIPWRRNLTKNQTIHVKFDKDEENEIVEPQPKEKKPSIFSKIPKIKMPQKNSNNDEKISKVEPIQDIAQPTTNAIEPENKTEVEVIAAPTDEWEIKKEKPPIINQVFGTVVIGVGSVADHLGATNFSISLAKYLTDNDYKVALIEGNHSMDFDRIHSLIEGEHVTLKETSFTLKGIKHIKYREGLNLGELYTNYQYVILDLGNLKTSPLKEELYRAHVKCIMASADEWKYHWIEEFLLNHTVDDLTFIVPGGNPKGMSDLDTRLKKHTVFASPIHDSPYVIKEEHTEHYQKLLSSVLVNTTNKGRGKMLLTGLVGATVATAIFMLVNLFI